MDKNNKLLSFLMLKEENYQELNDVVKKYDLVNKKFLKVSTFKVSYTGNGIGNKYLSIIDVTAKKVGACLIYITVYPKLEVFIEFLKRHGYIVAGNYNRELVLVKKVKD
ncbi:prophage protein [Mycoplasma sp. CAG:956]|nr:prophage protein [Mycoplasma sp. CAG:956]